MSREYDAIVVGARCGGSPTAMLLARKGYRVLLVDKATFPSDTISTHLIHPPGWRRSRAGGSSSSSRRPAVRSSRATRSTSAPLRSRALHDRSTATKVYAPRRIVLDALLVEAAVAAGAELREGFTVEEILVEGGRVTGTRGHAKGGEAVIDRAW